MDWLPDSDLFIAPNNFDLFDYEFEVRNEGQECKVIQNWGLEAVRRLLTRFPPANNTDPKRRLKAPR